MATKTKFQPPVMTRRGGGKHTEHDAKWIGDVVAAVKSGTPDAIKRLPIAYHGVAPHMQTETDMNEPIAARPSAEPAEPADVPDADDMTRTLDATALPTSHGMKGASAGGKVPATCGASAAPKPIDPFAK